ncbi:AMP-binding protein [Pelomyxa schiedti]|nr:AMP-binding protein [Pelomyxa schiedti]
MPGFRAAKTSCLVTFYFKHGAVVSGGYASVWMCIIRNVTCLILGQPSEVASSLPPSELERIDLSSLSTAIITGDSISAALLEKCRQSFSVCHLKRNVLLPMYTIAEATFLTHPPCVVYVRRSALQKLEVDVAFCFGPDTRSVVSCGTPTPPATSVCIVDIKTHEECKPGHVGEIWVYGSALASGYMSGDPSAICTRFEGFEERSLSTGDVGFIHDDKLFVLGRLCDLICLADGRYFFPEDVEAVVNSFSGIADSAAFVVEEDGKNTVVVAEASPDFSSPEMAIPVLAEIAHKVIEDLNLQIESILLVKQGVLRRTAGKIQRQMCLEDHRIFEVIVQWNRTPPISATPAPTPSSPVGGQVPLPHTATSPSQLGSPLLPTQLATTHQSPQVTQLSPRALEIAEWLARRVSIKLGGGDVDLQAPFFTLGLTSASVIALAAELEAWIGAKLTPTLLFEYPNIEQLSQYLAHDDIKPTAGVSEDTVV